jgi:DNA helicase-2/ATP-dependent DNA helicase PcrA
MIMRQGMHVHAARTRHTESFSTWTLPPGPGASAKAKSAPILEPRFKAGMKVKHAAWGEGLVVDVRLQDGDERIDVYFESAGFKRLLGSIANLEIIQQ